MDEIEMTAEVTVVIPTLNRRALLLRTLHSVLQQKNVRIAVVVVIDGGSDGSAEAVEALGDARIRIIRHASPRGVSAARNAGLAVVRTDWVAFVDDDDLFAPSKLAAQLEALRRLPETRWSCVSAVDVDEGARPRRWASIPSGERIADQLLVKNVVPGGGSGVLVLTGLAREVGGFDETISNLADWDFYIRLAVEAGVAPVADHLIAYTVQSGGMSLNARRAVAEYEYLARKHAGERRRRSVSLDRGDWNLYMATVAWRGGDRWWALPRFATAMRLGPSAHRLSLVLRTMAPAPVRALKRRIAPDRRRLAWLDEYQRWREAPFVPQAS